MFDAVYRFNGRRLQVVSTKAARSVQLDLFLKDRCRCFEK